MNHIILILISLIMVACNESTAPSEVTRYDPTINEILTGLQLSDNVDSIYSEYSDFSSDMILRTYDSIITINSQNGKRNSDTSPPDTSIYDSLIFEYKLHRIESYYNNGSTSQIRLTATTATPSPCELRSLLYVEHNKIEQEYYYIDLSINNNTNTLTKITIHTMGDSFCGVIGVNSTINEESGYYLDNWVVFQ